jgi:hypothetical protein
MRYRLRTLLIVLALGPPVLAFLWTWYLWSQETSLIETVGPPDLPPIVGKSSGY